MKWVVVILILLSSLSLGNPNKLDYSLLRALTNIKTEDTKGIKIKELGKEKNIDKVKVLKKNGKVEVIPLSYNTLKKLLNDPNIVYIEAPKPIKLLNDILSFSSYALRGYGNAIITIQDPGSGIWIFKDDKNISNLNVDQNCSLVGTSYYLCTNSASYTLTVESLGNFRLVVMGIMLRKNHINADTTIETYSVGTGSMDTTNTGEGVLVGIIDSGINLCHPMFLDNQGNTRIRYFGFIADYFTCALKGGNYDASTSICEFDYSVINMKIINDDCNYDINGHGTHVTGTAVGRDEDFPGIAQRAELLIFGLNGNAGTSIDFIQDGTDVDVIKALEWIYQKAQYLGKPVVVNMSLGMNTGPHDGTGLLDRKVDELSKEGFIVVAAAGNEALKAIHAYTTRPFDVIPIEVSKEINNVYGVIVNGWYKNPAKWKVEVCDSNGSYCVGADPGKDMTLSKTIYGTYCEALVLNSITESPLNGDGWFYIEIICSKNSKLTLKLTQVCGEAARVDMWDVLETGAFALAAFNTLKDPYGGYMFTVGSPGTSKEAITVGAINSKPSYELDSQTGMDTFTNLGLIANFSSRGPTRDGRIKPDVVAGGAYVVSASNIYPHEVYNVLAGTSMATPVVTGLVALYLESNPYATPKEVKKWLASNAINDYISSNHPNVTYGYGKATWGDKFLSDGYTEDANVQIKIGNGVGVCKQEEEETDDNDNKEDIHNVKIIDRTGCMFINATFMYTFVLIFFGFIIFKRKYL